MFFPTACTVCSRSWILKVLGCACRLKYRTQQGNSTQGDGQGVRDFLQGLFNPTPKPRWVIRVIGWPKTVGRESCSWWCGKQAGRAPAQPLCGAVVQSLFAGSSAKHVCLLLPPSPLCREFLCRHAGCAAAPGRAVVCMWVHRAHVPCHSTSHQGDARHGPQMQGQFVSQSTLCCWLQGSCAGFVVAPQAQEQHLTCPCND